MRTTLGFAAAALASLTSARSDQCQIHSATFGKFDLRGLRKSSGDWEVENTNGDLYNLNFCGPINTQAWAVSSPELVGAYQQGSNGGISLGNFDTDPDMERGVLSFSYTGGSACPKSSARRATVIQLQCDNSWSSGKLQLVKVIDECSYFFNLKTPYACPTSFTSSVLGSVWAFISFIAIAAAVSLASAVVYNRIVLKQRGMDQFPSMNKVQDALSFVKDIAIIAGIWVLDTLQKIFTAFKASPSWNRTRSNVDYGAWSRNARNEFQAVPQDRQEADLPAPPGILDDDDDEEEDERARVVLGDEEEMLGEPQRKEKNGPERFRDDQ